MADRDLRVGEAVVLVGETVGTLLHWERMGWLRPHRDANGRLYSERDLLNAALRDPGRGPGSDVRAGAPTPRRPREKLRQTRHSSRA